jgi:hypothetical protein
MIEASLLGGLLGGATRLAPELFKFFDRKGERKHELLMFENQIKLDEARTANQISIIDQQAANEQFKVAVEALQESVKSQATQSGIKIIDGINALVRPTVTYIVFAMWVGVKLITLNHYTSEMELFAAVKVWWTDADQAMMAAILNFWFLGRVFDKALR